MHHYDTNLGAQIVDDCFAFLCSFMERNYISDFRSGDRFIEFTAHVELVSASLIDFEVPEIEADLLMHEVKSIF